MTNEGLIFSGLLKPMEICRERRAEFLSLFNNEGLFKNEWYIFYTLIRAYPKIEFTRDFIRIYLETNKGILTTRCRYLDLSAFALGSTDPYLTFIDSCLTELKNCSEYNIQESDYQMAIETFRLQYVNDAGITLLEQGAQILAEGLQVSSNKTLAGFQDMNNFVIQGITRLSNMLNRTNRKGVLVYGADMSQEEERPLAKVCSFGLETVDKCLGGLYETDMLSILAPPKGGKSRFSAYLVHQALIQGTSVVTWSLENGLKGIEALIRACHFDWYYNRSQADITKRHIINADDIRKNTLTGDMKELEEASWLDLRTNPNYGLWANIDDEFEADTFLTVLDNAVDSVGAKLVDIDYLQLITGDGKQAKNERIGSCYQKLLRYIQSKYIAAICPAQFRSVFVGDLSKKSSADIANMELRDGGGESSEVIRTPSVLMALYADTVSLRNGELKLLSIPSRNAATFPPVDLYADFSVCNFIEVAQKSE